MADAVTKAHTQVLPACYNLSAWLYFAAGTETHSTEFSLSYCQRRGNAVMVMTLWLRDCTSRHFDTTTMIHEPNCPSLLHICITSHFVSSSEKFKASATMIGTNKTPFAKPGLFTHVCLGAGRLPIIREPSTRHMCLPDTSDLGRGASRVYGTIVLASAWLGPDHEGELPPLHRP